MNVKVSKRRAAQWRIFAAMRPLLPACYFGPVELYALLARHAVATIDTGEHYVRQSHRTRTRIAGPNGVQDLSVQIVHDHGRKMPMNTVRLSRAESWPQQHVHAIRSAYGQSPWFIHFIDDIEAVLLAPHERLVDLDLATMRLALKWLRIPVALEVTDQYVERTEGMLDQRTTFHPKKPLPPEVPAVAPYAQVFADRHGYQPGLSVIDLVMNLGPMAREALRAAGPGLDR